MIGLPAAGGYAGVVEADPIALPGGRLVDEGLDDLRAGRPTAAALLVATGRQRLTALGIQVPEMPAVERPSHELYLLLAAEDPASAHGRYNALIRQLVSYARAADSATARR